MVFPGKAHDHFHDLLRGPGIQVSGGLICKHHLGPGHKGPRDPGPLLLAARHLPRIVMQTVGQAHPS